MKKEDLVSSSGCFYLNVLNKFCLKYLEEKYKAANIPQKFGQAAEILLNICQRIKDKFQLPWRMISLVDVILKNAKENQDDAWSRIEEAFLEFRALAAVEAASGSSNLSPRLPAIHVYLPPSFVDFGGAHVFLTDVAFTPIWHDAHQAGQSDVMRKFELPNQPNY
ncbi:hypothetical protein JTB14_021136 [Gonioctena quinquepunctata]|nr:hypothetical protein JTB14_021136 [Gonioctena quinquepunctata]